MENDYTLQWATLRSILGPPDDSWERGNAQAWGVKHSEAEFCVSSPAYWTKLHGWRVRRVPYRIWEDVPFERILELAREHAARR